MAVPQIGVSIMPAFQWTVDRLFDQLRQLRAKAAEEARTISTNNGRLVALNRSADEVSDPAQRAALRAWIQRSVQRQITIVRHWRAGSARVAALAKRAGDWLRQHGIAPSGLGDVGAAQAIVVPVVIIGLVALAWAAVFYVHEENAAQNKAIALQEHGLASLVHAGATPEQINAYMASAEKAIADTQPKGSDPFGMQDLVKALTPIAVIAGAALLFPPVLEAVRAMRPRRA